MPGPLALADKLHGKFALCGNVAVEHHEQRAGLVLAAVEIPTLVGLGDNAVHRGPRAEVVATVGAPPSVLRLDRGRILKHLDLADHCVTGTAGTAVWKAVV